MKIKKIVPGIKNNLLRLKSEINWRSKLVDLFIVMIGITLAFRLNSWAESKKDHRAIGRWLRWAVSNR